MGSDISDPSAMQIIAFSNSQRLLYDFSNSESFYLYTVATRGITALTSAAAKAFYQAAPNQSQGITSWGYTQAESRPRLSNQVPIVALTDDTGTIILTTDDGTGTILTPG